MTRSRLSTFVILLLLFVALLAAAPTSADGGGTLPERAGAVAPRSVNDEGAHTVTWWCVDLNELWHVDVPVLVGFGAVTPPDPSPVPTCPTTSTFPIVVSAGSGWVSGGAAIWYTHTHYTQQILDALGPEYRFVSNSPMEDMLQEMTAVRYVVRTVPANAIVAEHTFDPRLVFRLVRANQYFGELTLAPTSFPELGIELSSEAMGRLPLVLFPAVGEALPPGTYRAQMFYVFSDLHNDGLGMGPGNFLGPGEFLWAQPLFVVAP
jgi:hypothetical protein